MCITVISGTFLLQLAIFVAVFLLIRLRPPWSGGVTARLVGCAAVVFLASVAFLAYIGLHYGCG
jgi:hypothetical protein